MTATASPAIAPPAPILPGDPAGSSAVGRWLLEGPVQIARGAHAGAIAGTLHDGHATYVYPEIAGYYLQWLAWRARTFGGTPALALRAERVQRWLATWLAADATPKTRLYIDAADDDWRNGALFFFDVAMVARGLAAAADNGLLVPNAAVVGGLSGTLRRLVAADGMYAACIAIDPAAALPQRWSTRRGGFLAKAAAGVVTAGRSLAGLPADVLAAAHATFAASLDWMRDAPHPEAHPLLYTFEGVMALPEDARFPATLAEIAAQFDTLLAHAGPDGDLPETLHASCDGSGPARTDVLAQTLRIGCLLRAHLPQRPVDRAALARVAGALARAVRPSGAVAFAREAPPANANVWAAMFADQAFAMGSQRPEDRGWWRGDPLLV